jgi:anti-sigma factor RsiW
MRADRRAERTEIMNHPAALPWLPAYADGEIGPIRRFWLRRHVVGCPSCLAELEALQSMRDALRTALQSMRDAQRTNLTFHRAPPALATRIASALSREAPPPILRRSAKRFGFAGSVLAGGLAAIIWPTPHRIDPIASRRRGESHPLHDGRTPDRCAY